MKVKIFYNTGKVARLDVEREVLRQTLSIDYHNIDSVVVEQVLTKEQIGDFVIANKLKLNDVFSIGD